MAPKSVPNVEGPNIPGEIVLLKKLSTMHLRSEVIFDQSQCLSRSSGSRYKSVAEVMANSDDDTAFLGTITEGSKPNCWKSKIIIEEKDPL